MGTGFAVTVNHSVWFHRQVDFSDCALLHRVAGGRRTRGLSMGHFQPGGEVVATVAQEGIVKYFPGK